ncbi:oligosaccharide flippase family protein [uncultured Albimonas sp.]|uniref:oligosaccharide flippase family protein n=1 Tax=uncultured Albimonas sp. TaxID=1331701 RepID=UPI0030EE0173|tara:strand:- start:4600 stop:5853 length:1254 start_codon:yes stop_codon:yes gene_type:complete
MSRPSSLGGLVRNLGAVGVSEAAAKASRLAVVIAMARSLDPLAIGLAATALAASDLLKAFTQAGIGQRIIAAPEAELEAVCRAAARLFRILCLGLAALQVGVGAAMWALGADVAVFAMVALLAAEYLFMPAGLVSCFLAMREGRLQGVSAVAGAQVVGANLATAALVAVFASPFAIVAPKVLSAPLWTLGMRRLRPWRATPGPVAPTRPFLRFGAGVMAAHIFDAARQQADKLIVAALLGAEALGVWYFAVNAGLGLASSFAAAFATVLFPHVCAAGDRAAAMRQGLGVGLALILPAILAQALLAPWYVPAVFGAEWAGVAPLVGILCLGAAPLVIWSAAAQWLRAQDRSGAEARGTGLAAVALCAGLAIAAPFGLEAAAWTYVGVAAAVQLGLAARALAPAVLPAFARARRVAPLA